MNILFYILPVFISILVMLTKKKIVNAKSGKKFAIREMVLDLLKVLLIIIIAMIGNFICGKSISIWTLLIDVFMLMVYLFPLMQKNFDYAERKAVMGILASLVFMSVICISMYQMVIGTYNRNDTTLAFCFLKGVSYFFISTWCCFTYEKDKKIKGLFHELKSSIRMYKLSKLEYYVGAFVGLFIFIGGNGNFTPFCIFGIHEILNKKILKGVLYIILGNISLILQCILPFWGSISFTVYILVASVDLFVQFIKK